MKRFRIAFIALAATAFLAISSFAERIPDYAEDLGPTTIDVSKYPADMQQGYKLMEAKCMRCHTVARAVNSPWTGAKDWTRYINRMRLRPPCCNQCPVITRNDAKAIYRFLVYDSRLRKTGARAAEWSAFRDQLLKQYEQKYPKQYAQRYQNKSAQEKEHP